MANVDDSLKNQILSARNMSADNTVVTYDLTSGIDFSHPRKSAEAFAEVFFENDASKWFTAKENDVEFHHAYKAKIRIAEEDNKKVKATMDDFMKDLDKDELRKQFSEQIRAQANYHSGLGMVMLTGFLTSMIIQQHEQGVQMDQYVQKLLDNIKSNTEIEDVSKP